MPKRGNQAVYNLGPGLRESHDPRTEKNWGWREKTNQTTQSHEQAKRNHIDYGFWPLSAREARPSPC